MSDARSLTYVLQHKKPLKVIVSLVTLVAFLFNTVSYDLAWAVNDPAALTSVGADRTGGPGASKELRVDTFMLPPNLGTIQYAKEAAGGGSDTVIHIQDAHCNYPAQKKIAEIIEYLHDQYGIRMVNLEGGARDYNLTIFTGIADKLIREKVADGFVGEGRVSGAEYFAINNPEKVTLWGIEDPKLYIQNLNVYRDSARYRGEVDKDLKILSHILSNLKMHVYSKPLMSFDAKYSQYKANNLPFKDYLDALVKMARGSAIDVKSFKNIYLLSKTLDEEAAIDFKAANAQRDELIDKLQKHLSKVAAEEMIVKTVEFKSDRMSHKEYYGYLSDKARAIGADISAYPMLQKYMLYITMYEAVDKSRTMAELEILEDGIRSALCTTDDERELALLSKNLSIMKNFFNISITRGDYEYYKRNADSFRMDRYVSFIDRMAPLYKIDARPGKDITRIDGYRSEMAQFYEYSFMRDDAFIKNLQFPIDDKRKTINEKRVAILVTGGFHTDNLRDLFLDKGISYISVLPNFKSEEGYQKKYYSLLQGKGDPVQDKILEALPKALAVASFMSNIPSDERRKAFDIEVKLREARMMGKDGILMLYGTNKLAIGLDGSVLKDYDPNILMPVSFAKAPLAAPATDVGVQAHVAGLTSAPAVPVIGTGSWSENRIMQIMAPVTETVAVGLFAWALNMMAGGGAIAQVSVGIASGLAYLVPHFRYTKGRGLHLADHSGWSAVLPLGAAYGFAAYLYASGNPYLNSMVGAVLFAHGIVNTFRIYSADAAKKKAGTLKGILPAVSSSAAATSEAARLEKRSINLTVASWVSIAIQGFIFAEALMLPANVGVLSAVGNANIPLFYAGVAMIVVSLALYLAATAYHPSKKTVTTLNVPDRLRTDGPYRYLRHPMNSSQVVFAASIALLSIAVPCSLAARIFTVAAGIVAIGLLRTLSGYEERAILGSPLGAEYSLHMVRSLDVLFLPPVMAWLGLDGRRGTPAAVSPGDVFARGKGAIPLFKWIYGKIAGLSGSALDRAYYLRNGPFIEEAIFTAGALAVALWAGSPDILTLFAVVFSGLHLFGRIRGGTPTERRDELLYGRFLKPAAITLAATLFQYFVSFPMLQQMDIVAKVGMISVLWFAVSWVHLAINVLSDRTRPIVSRLRFAAAMIPVSFMYAVLSSGIFTRYGIQTEQSGAGILRSATATVPAAEASVPVDWEALDARIPVAPASAAVSPGPSTLLGIGPSAPLGAGGAMKRMGDEDTRREAKDLRKMIDGKIGEIAKLQSDESLMTSEIRSILDNEQAKGVSKKMVISVSALGADAVAAMGAIPATHVLIGGVLFIILNKNLSPPIAKEAVYHEIREAALMAEGWVAKLATDLNAKYGKADDPVTSQRVAHIIASNQQAHKFAPAGITPYHERELLSMDGAALKNLLNEYFSGRDLHKEVMAAAASRQDIKDSIIQGYDERIMSKAVELMYPSFVSHFTSYKGPGSPLPNISLKQLFSPSILSMATIDSDMIIKGGYIKPAYDSVLTLLERLVKAKDEEKGGIQAMLERPVKEALERDPDFISKLKQAILDRPVLREYVLGKDDLYALRPNEDPGRPADDYDAGGLKALTDVLEDRDELKKFLFVMSVLRLGFDQHIIDGADPNAPLGFANGREKPYVYKYNESISICPIAESFRRHILIVKDAATGTERKVEIKIPGDYEGKQVINRMNHEVAVKAWERDGDASGVVRPAIVRSVNGRFGLYGREIVADEPTDPMNIVVLGYEDGRRLARIRADFDVIKDPYLEAVLARVKGKAARERWTEVEKGYGEWQVQDLKRDIILQTMRAAKRLLDMGYDPGGDMHIENFRLLEDGRVVSVADFGDYEMTGDGTPKKPLTAEEKREEVINLIMPLALAWGCDFNELYDIIDPSMKEDHINPLDSYFKNLITRPHYYPPTWSVGAQIRGSLNYLTTPSNPNFAYLDKLTLPDIEKYAKFRPRPFKMTTEKTILDMDGYYRLMDSKSGFNNIIRIPDLMLRNIYTSIVVIGKRLFPKIKPFGMTGIIIGMVASIAASIAKALDVLGPESAGAMAWMGVAIGGFFILTANIYRMYLTNILRREESVWRMASDDTLADRVSGSFRYRGERDVSSITIVKEMRDMSLGEFSKTITKDPGLTDSAARSAIKQFESLGYWEDIRNGKTLYINTLSIGWISPGNIYVNNALFDGRANRLFVLRDAAGASTVGFGLVMAHERGKRAFFRSPFLSRNFGLITAELIGNLYELGFFIKNIFSGINASVILGGLWYSLSSFANYSIMPTVALANDAGAGASAGIGAASKVFLRIRQAVGPWRSRAAATIIASSARSALRQDDNAMVDRMIRLIREYAERGFPDREDGLFEYAMLVYRLSSMGGISISDQQLSVLDYAMQAEPADSFIRPLLAGIIDKAASTPPAAPTTGPPAAGGMWVAPESTALSGAPYKRVAVGLETFFAVGAALALFLNLGLVLSASAAAAAIFFAPHLRYESGRGLFGVYIVDRARVAAPVLAVFTFLASYSSLGSAGVWAAAPVLALMAAHYLINLLPQLRATRARPVTFAAEREKMAQEQILSLLRSLNSSNMTSYTNEKPLTIASAAERLSELGMADASERAFGEAIEAVNDIVGTDSMSIASGDVAKAMARTGDISRALDTAGSIKSPYARAMAIASVALVLAEELRHSAAAGALSKAVDVVNEEVGEPYYKARSLAFIARIYASLGMARAADRYFKAALKEADYSAVEPEDLFYRSTVYIFIAKAMAEAGKSKEADEVVTAYALPIIGGISLRSRGWISIADELARAGWISAAIETANLIERQDYRERAYTNIFMILDPERGRVVAGVRVAEVGLKERPETVMASLEKVPDGRYRPILSSAVSKVLADAGNIDEAMAVEAGIDAKNGYDKARALAAIAKALARSGRTAEAVERFASAMAEAKRWDGDAQRRMAISLISRSLADSGMPDEAAAAIGELPESQYLDRSVALAAISASLARLGRVAEAGGYFTQALRASYAIDDVNARSRAIRVVSDTMARSGIMDQASRERAAAAVRRLLSVIDEAVGAGYESVEPPVQALLMSGMRIEDIERIFVSERSVFGLYLLAMQRSGDAADILGLLRSLSLAVKADPQAFGNEVIDGIPALKAAIPATTKYIADREVVVTPGEKIVNTVLLPLSFKRPDLFRGRLERLKELFPDNMEELKYLLFFASRDLSAGLPYDERAFPHQKAFGEMMARPGPLRVLVMHNMRDGQGDELIRVSPFVQALLDARDDIEVVIYTRRPYLYASDGRKVTAINIDDYEKAPPEGRYDIVMRYYDSGEGYSEDTDRLFRSRFDPEKSPAGLYVEMDKKAGKGVNMTGGMFAYNEVLMGGRSVELPILGDNAYLQAYQLCAELGLKTLRLGTERSRRSLLTGVPNPIADNCWKDFVEKANRDGRPVLIFNGFGGEQENKGYDRSEAGQIAHARAVEEAVKAGYFVVIMPNGRRWGTYDIARKIEKRARKARGHVWVAFSPDDGERLRGYLRDSGRGEMSAEDAKAQAGLLYKYMVDKADLIYTVEGGLMHLAYNMGKPIRAKSMIGSGGMDVWLPMGADVSQAVVGRDIGTGLRSHAAAAAPRAPPANPHAPQRFGRLGAILGSAMSLLFMLNVLAGPDTAYAGSLGMAEGAAASGRLLRPAPALVAPGQAQPAAGASDLVLLPELNVPPSNLQDWKGLIIGYDSKFDKTYENLLSVVPDETEILVVVDSLSSPELRRLCNRITEKRPGLKKRIMVTERRTQEGLRTETAPVSVWVRDPLIYADGRDGRGRVLYSKHIEQMYKGNFGNDHLIPDAVARSIGSEPVRLPFDIVGGDTIFSEINGKRYVFIGDHSVEMNSFYFAKNGEYKSRPTIKQEMRAFFMDKMGYDDIIFLPSYDKRSHIDMQVTLVDGGRAVVGSLKLGMAGFFGQMVADLNAELNKGRLPKEAAGYVGTIEKALKGRPGAAGLSELLAKGGSFATGGGAWKGIEDRLREIDSAVEGLEGISESGAVESEAVDEICKRYRGYDFSTEGFNGWNGALADTVRILESKGYRVESAPWVGTLAPRKKPAPPEPIDYIFRVLKALAGIETQPDPVGEPIATFNNVIFMPGNTVLVPKLGIDTLDEMAKKAWERLGFKVVMIDARPTLSEGGGWRCITQPVKYLPGLDRVATKRPEDLRTDFATQPVLRSIAVWIWRALILWIFGRVLVEELERRKLRGGGIKGAMPRTGGMWLSPEYSRFGVRYGTIAFALESLLTLGAASVLFYFFGSDPAWLSVAAGSTLFAPHFRYGKVRGIYKAEQAGWGALSLLAPLTSVASYALFTGNPHAVWLVPALVLGHFIINLLPASRAPPLAASPAIDEALPLGAAAPALSAPAASRLDAAIAQRMTVQGIRLPENMMDAAELCGGDGALVAELAGRIAAMRNEAYMHQFDADGIAKEIEDKSRKVFVLMGTDERSGKIVIAGSVTVKLGFRRRSDIASIDFVARAKAYAGHRKGDVLLKRAIDHALDSGATILIVDTDVPALKDALTGFQRHPGVSSGKFNGDRIPVSDDELRRWMLRRMTEGERKKERISVGERPNARRGDSESMAWHIERLAGPAASTVPSESDETSAAAATGFAPAAAQAPPARAAAPARVTPASAQLPDRLGSPEAVTDVSPLEAAARKAVYEHFRSKLPARYTDDMVMREAESSYSVVKDVYMMARSLAEHTRNTHAVDLSELPMLAYTDYLHRELNRKNDERLRKIFPSLYDNDYFKEHWNSYADIAWSMLISGVMWGGVSPHKGLMGIWVSHGSPVGKGAWSVIESDVMKMVSQFMKTELFDEASKAAKREMLPGILDDLKRYFEAQIASKEMPVDGTPILESIFAQAILRAARDPAFAAEFKVPKNTMQAIYMLKLDSQKAMRLYDQLLKDEAGADTIDMDLERDGEMVIRALARQYRSSVAESIEEATDDAVALFISNFKQERLEQRYRDIFVNSARVMKESVGRGLRSLESGNYTLGTTLILQGIDKLQIRDLDEDARVKLGTIIDNMLNYFEKNAGIKREALNDAIWRDLEAYFAPKVFPPDEAAVADIARPVPAAIGPAPEAALIGRINAQDETVVAQVAAMETEARESLLKQLGEAARKWLEEQLARMQPKPPAAAPAPVDVPASETGPGVELKGLGPVDAAAVEAYMKADVNARGGLWERLSEAARRWIEKNMKELIPPAGKERRERKSVAYRTEVSVIEGKVYVVDIDEYGRAMPETGRTLAAGETYEVLMRSGRGAIEVMAPSRPASEYVAGTYRTYVTVGDGAVAIQTLNKRGKIAGVIYVDSGQSARITGKIEAPPAPTGRAAEMKGHLNGKYPGSVADVRSVAGKDGKAELEVIFAYGPATARLPADISDGEAQKFIGERINEFVEIKSELAAYAMVMNASLGTEEAAKLDGAMATVAGMIQEAKSSPRPAVNGEGKRKMSNGEAEAFKARILAKIVLPDDLKKIESESPSVLLNLGNNGTWRQRLADMNDGRALPAFGTRAVRVETAVALPAIYKSAQETIPAIVASVNKQAYTYVTAPANDDELVKDVNIDKGVERVLGRDGHFVKANHYSLAGGAEALKKLLMGKDGDYRLLAEFNDIVNKDRDRNHTARWAIRVRAEDRGEILKLLESKMRELNKDDEEAFNRVWARMYVIPISVPAEARLNPVIDLFADFGMLELDRYGRPKEYPGSPSPSFKASVARLLKESTTNFDDANADTIMEIIKRIFSGAETLRIRAVDWKSFQDWKKHQDAVLSSV